MKRLMCPASLALTALALLGLAVPGGAQDLTKDQVPFKAAVKANADAFAIPVAPPMVSVRMTGSGETTSLGKFTFVGHDLAHLGVDGAPKSATDGVGVMTGANGDAIFVTWVSLITIPKPGFVTDNGVFTITGGSGRFACATGGGVFSTLVDLGKNELGASFEGTISALKK